MPVTEKWLPRQIERSAGTEFGLRSAATNIDRRGVPKGFLAGLFCLIGNKKAQGVAVGQRQSSRHIQPTAATSRRLRGRSIQCGRLKQLQRRRTLALGDVQRLGSHAGLHIVLQLLLLKRGSAGYGGNVHEGGIGRKVIVICGFQGETRRPIIGMQNDE